MDEAAGSSAPELGPIALALSGGGYRAAAFHLGTMKALAELDLLRDVRWLSTASGGSIIGARWVLSLLAGHTFAEFEAAMDAILRRNIIAAALDRLHRGSRPVSLSQRAAEVYDDLFEGQRLGALAAGLKSHTGGMARLEHVIINATHFSLGYGFRFTFPPRGNAPLGNRAAKFEPTDGAWQDIRLADAVAASACFPAGFEPLHFPDDFSWSGAPPRVWARGLDSNEEEQTVPLMDGGIFDNQAIDALLLIDDASDSTRRPDDDIGVLFCSDTDQKHMPFYARPRCHAFWHFLGRVPLWALAMAAAAVTAALACWARTGTGRPAVLAAVGATLAGMLLAAIVGLLVVAQIKVPFRYWLAGKLLRTPLRDLWHLAIARVRSVLALTSSVFMYRVRALGYNVARLRMRHRVVPSQIYDYDHPKPRVATPFDTPSEAVRTRAARARKVRTQLWMSAEEREVVVQAGYAAALGALGHYLRRWQKASPDARSFRDMPYPTALAARVEALWKRLNG